MISKGTPRLLISTNVFESAKIQHNSGNNSKKSVKHLIKKLKSWSKKVVQVFINKGNLFRFYPNVVCAMHGNNLKLINLFAIKYNPKFFKRVNYEINA